MPKFCLPRFSRSCGRLGICAAGLALASALLAVSCEAAEKSGGTTVFTNADGSAWAISVRPAQKTARATSRTLAVPAVPDPQRDVAMSSVTKPAEPRTDVQQVAYQPNETLPDLPASADNNFGIVITPAESSLNIEGRDYQKAYRSIPYRHEEYLANPSYRHDAAMELLFGEMRPTTIVRQSNPQTVVNPRYSSYQPYWVTPSELYEPQRSLRYLDWPVEFGTYGCVLPE